MLSNASTSNVKAYPSGVLHKATNYSTRGSPFDYGGLNNCTKNTMCYTTSNNLFIYKPHSAYGMVGRSAAGYLGQRRRL